MQTYVNNLNLRLSGNIYNVFSRHNNTMIIKQCVCIDLIESVITAKVEMLEI